MGNAPCPHDPCRERKGETEERRARRSGGRLAGSLSVAAAAQRVQIHGVGVATAARGFGRGHGRLVALGRGVLQARVGRDAGDAEQPQRFLQLLVPLHRLDVLLLEMALVHQDRGFLLVPHLIQSFIISQSIQNDGWTNL